ncbi:hypothetical protein MRX96_055803 [Rhipicephalus microplus]
MTRLYGSHHHPHWDHVTTLQRRNVLRRALGPLRSVGVETGRGVVRLKVHARAEGCRLSGPLLFKREARGCVCVVSVEARLPSLKLPTLYYDRLICADEDVSPPPGPEAPSRMR